MQCVEHVAAQLIANLRVQKPEIAPFLPSEIAFQDPPGPVFCTRKDSCFNKDVQTADTRSLSIRLKKCSHPSVIRLKKCNGSMVIR